MAIAKLVLNSDTQIDLTTDTVASSDHIMEGYVGHLRNGTSVTGTGKIAASEQAALDALVRYSNEVTGESDTTISEAVETLVDGYGQGFTAEDIATGADLWGDVTINSTYIRGYAFPRSWDTHSGQTMSKARSITSLYAPNCIYIGEYAFRLQTNLTRVILPECTTIEASAFSGYSSYHYMSVTELYMPKVETIGNNAFYFNKHGFEKLVLPESLRTLGNYCFASNEYLKTVYFMGSNVTSIGSTCFTSGVQTITDIYVPWSEGAVANAPWGANSATIHYNTVYDSNGEPTA